MDSSNHRAPQRVAVIGAGMVGLATAWHLQERGVGVTVLDRAGVAAGSSWGNAGWLTPSIAVPLPEPSVLKYGIRAVLSPSSPVYVPPTLDPRLIRFLVQFARNCTPKRWGQAMKALIPLNNDALEAYAELEAGGITARTKPADSFVAGYKTAQEREALLDEIRLIQSCGQDVGHVLLDGDEARQHEPLLSEQITAAVRFTGQRYIDPSSYVHSIADAVQARGAEIHSDRDVSAVDARPDAVVIGGETYDAVVIANGARLGDLARPFGVRRIVQAGRGYSFTVKVDTMPNGPLYLPAQRLACTPAGDRLRIAGMMEFRDVGAPLDPRRIKALTNAADGLLVGTHLEHREDEWVGARPCTADGLPLIGATNDPRVFVAGGHGMWGITLGPITGRLLADQIVTGRTPDALRAVDPLR